MKTRFRWRWPARNIHQENLSTENISFGDDSCCIRLPFRVEKIGLRTTRLGLLLIRLVWLPDKARFRYSKEQLTYFDGRARRWTQLYGPCWYGQDRVVTPLPNITFYSKVRRRTANTPRAPGAATQIRTSSRTSSAKRDLSMDRG